MTARTAQMARIMAATYSEMVERDGFPQVTAPDDVTDAAHFPRIAEIERERARMTPEQRAELNAGWPGDWT